MCRLCVWRRHIWKSSCVIQRTTRHYYPHHGQLNAQLSIPQIYIISYNNLCFSIAPVSVLTVGNRCSYVTVCAVGNAEESRAFPAAENIFRAKTRDGPGEEEQVTTMQLWSCSKFIAWYTECADVMIHFHKFCCACIHCVMAAWGSWCYSHLYEADVYN